MITSYLIALVVLPVFVLTAGVILYRWRFGVYFMFIWLFAGDMVRRLIPGQPPEIMLIGDVLLFLTYCSFLAMLAIKRKGLWMPPFAITFLLFAAIVVINVLNPLSPEMLFGIIGLRSYLWYVPLLFLGYYMFTTEDQLLRFCRVLVYAAIPLFVFAVIQYIFYDLVSPLLHPFEAGHQYRFFSLVEVGIVRRIPSVFGEAQRYAVVSMFLFFVGMALYLSTRLSTRNNKLLLIAVICAFLGVTISASRAVFILSIVGSIAFYLFAVRPGRMRFDVRIVKIVLIVGLLLPVLLFGVYKFGGDVGLLQVSAFYFALEERIPWMLGDIGRVFAEGVYMGHGTGTMSQGLQHIPGGEEWRAAQLALRGGVWFESGVSKLIFELGILGLVLFYLLWGHVIYRMAKEVKKVNSSYLKNIAIAIGIFLSLVLVRFSFIHHQVLGDMFVLMIIWFFTGALFGLKDLVLKNSY